MLNQVRVAGAVLGVFAGLAVRVDWASRCARASLSVVVRSMMWDCTRWTSPCTLASSKQV